MRSSSIVGFETRPTRSDHPSISWEADIDNDADTSDNDEEDDNTENNLESDEGSEGKNDDDQRHNSTTTAKINTADKE
jgi:hypothetical protein